MEGRVGKTGKNHKQENR